MTPPEDDDAPRKGKRGPPSRGGPGTPVRVPPESLDIIDAYAKANGCSRQEAIRQLIAKGMLKDGG